MFDYNTPEYQWDGSILRELKDRSHLSTKDFALKLNLMEDDYQKYASGRYRPNLRLLVRIADYCGTSIDYLMGRSEHHVEFEEQLKIARSKLFEDWLNGAPRPGHFKDINPPWPYNVVEEILRHKLDDPLTQDQIDGFEEALSTFPERDQQFLREYYEDNKTLEEIGRNHSMSRERPRQVIEHMIFKLRYPPLRGFIKYGKEGYAIHRESIDIAAQLSKLEQDREELLARKKSFEKQLEELRGLEAEIKAVTGEAPKAFEPVKYIADINVDDMGLSVRSYNCIKRAGINTLAELLDVIDNRPEFFLKIRNFGRRSILEVFEKIFALTGITYKVTESIGASVIAIKRVE